MFSSTLRSTTYSRRTIAGLGGVLGAAALSVAVLAGAPADASPTVAATPTAPVTTLPAPTGPTHEFWLSRSAGAIRAKCITTARARVRITPSGQTEVMQVFASGLPKNTEFDLFVLQTPDAPFGLSWYQGDLESDGNGKASGTYVGRFNEETFSVAPGVAPAPVRHHAPIADGSTNPATAPIHQYHLGLWFNSPRDADRAGCGAAVTPFNGEHDAGAQAMSSRNFPVGDGPLGRIGS